MDKFDFINRIIALYPHAITDKTAQYDTYSRVLSNKVDYEQLMDIYANEYKDGFPPPAAILKELSARCIKQEAITAQKWLHVKVFNTLYNAITNGDCFPAGTTQEQMLNTYKNRFGGEGWKIIEVY